MVISSAYCRSEPVGITEQKAGIAKFALDIVR